MYKNQILKQSSEDLSLIPDKAITLTVTSPPYWNAIDYDRHSVDTEQDYRTRSYSEGYRSYSEYLDWLIDIFSKLLEKTRPGGFLAIIIGTVLLEGKHYPVPMDLTSRLTKEGWEFRQDIIWNKVTGGVKRAGSYIRYPYPGYYHPNIMTEYILLLRREGEPLYRHYSQKEKERAAGPINKLFTNEIANNIWHIAPVPPGYLDHPCPFPEEIPFRLISLFSYPENLVFDPFNGSGQTTKVAKYLNRDYLGFDTSKKYVEYAQKRLEDPPSLRKEQLINSIEKIDRETPREGKTKGHTRHGSGQRKNRGDQLSFFKD